MLVYLKPNSCEVFATRELAMDDQTNYGLWILVYESCRPGDEGNIWESDTFYENQDGDMIPTGCKAKLFCVKLREG